MRDRLASPEQKSMAASHPAILLFDKENLKKTEDEYGSVGRKYEPSEQEERRKLMQNYSNGLLKSIEKRARYGDSSAKRS
jgi:hypothetical protein